MKQAIGIFLSIFILLFISGCSGSTSAVNPALNDPTTLFSVKQAQDDAENVFSAIENVHPNIYFKTSRQEYSAAKANVLQSLTQPTTRIELYKRIAPVIAMIGDGHTNIWPPTDEFNAERNKGMLSFPFSIQYVQGSGIVIERNYSTD